MKIRAKIYFRAIPFLGLLLLFLSCIKENAEPQLKGQDVFFEINFTNFAWGDQASVIYVKSDGSVILNNGKNKFNYEESKGQLTVDQMKENIALATQIKKQLPITELNKYTSLIPNLTDTNFTKRVPAGADKGSFIFTAYKYNANENIYKAIKLAEDGDWVSNNTDPNAIIITEWLKSIQEDIF